MADGAKIPYVHATWNTFSGCQECGEECRNCWARAMAWRHAHNPTQCARYQGLTRMWKEQVQWTGNVNLFEPAALFIPFGWKKPRRIAADWMGDLFYEKVPFEHVAKVYAVFLFASWHTYLVLTKRPERAVDFHDWLQKVSGGDPVAYLNEAGRSFLPIEALSKSVRMQPSRFREWPLRNVWQGISAGTQKAWQERKPYLQATPAAVRFVSMEPMLEPIEMNLPRECDRDCAEHQEAVCPGGDGLCPSGPRIDWVIAGGESGPRARVCNIANLRSLKQQCREAEVAFYLKQVGRKAVHPAGEEICAFESYQQWVNKAASWLGGRSGGGYRYKKREKDFACLDAKGRICRIGGDFARARDEGTFPVRAVKLMELQDAKGADMKEWPEDLRVQELPKGVQ